MMVGTWWRPDLRNDESIHIRPHRGTNAQYDEFVTCNYDAIDRAARPWHLRDSFVSRLQSAWCVAVGNPVNAVPRGGGIANVTKP